MDDIVGELRDCAADSQECGYRSRAQVAMLRAADDIVALQGRINRQCQSVNELVAATEKCIAERDALRAMVETAEADAKRYRWLRDHANEAWVQWADEREDSTSADIDAAIDRARDVPSAGGVRA